MEESSISQLQAEGRRVSRPAYKGQKEMWKKLAICFFTAWMTTVGMLIWSITHRVPTVILPNGDIKEGY